MGALATTAPAVTRIVTLATAGFRFGIRLEDVERAFRMVAITPLPGAPPSLLGAVNVHGDVLAVADLCRRLGLPPRAYGPDAHLLITRTPRRRLALAVDEVQGVIEVAASAIASTAALAGAPHPVAGAVGLPDGVIFVQDMEAFLSAEEDGQLAAALRASP
jgi:purine-binding chemotaxis protein CheW